MGLRYGEVWGRTARFEVVDGKVVHDDSQLVKAQPFWRRNVFSFIFQCLFHFVFNNIFFAKNQTSFPISFQKCFSKSFR